MSLSEQEQRALQEIERSLLAEDPKFARTMPGSRSISAGNGTGGFTLRTVALMVLGLVLLIAGVALVTVSLWFVVLSIVGFVVMFGAGVVALRTQNGPAAFGTHGSARRSGSKPAPRASKIEENFRRRFEGQ
ncbi:hypothetical protein CAPI_03990 [Corynebacterium capitovis DSM 44611]|uniref:DUF3040 domain-containing protein n=1 Tax=Corynebacterium capitovis TaxID=131081 RepID=UPI00037B2304|nr:DUF3040 domain-containing protein [Corynebacterium capitovis]WKD57356.1 hypothetical protein CAPI_03990 [Corynebacterium capitovis DSM 44611]